jgi:DNA-binding NarL/FixJ family response regulator
MGCKILVGTCSEALAPVLEAVLRAGKIDADVSFAYSEADLHAMIRKEKPALVLIDAEAWRTAAHYVLSRIARDYKKVKVVVFCFHDILLKHAVRFIHFGVVSVLGFRQDKRAVSHGLRALVNGRDYIPDDVAEAYRQSEAHEFCGHKLTERETSVYELLIAGNGETEIKQRLALSIHTVRVHIRNIHGKFGVSNSRELMKFAIDKGDVAVSRKHWVSEQCTRSSEQFCCNKCGNKNMRGVLV